MEVGIEPTPEPLTGVARWAVPVGVIAGTGPFVLGFVSLAFLLVALGAELDESVDLGWLLVAGLIVIGAAGFALVVVTPVAIACAIGAVSRWWNAPTYGERDRWRVRAALGVLATIPSVVFTVTYVVVIVRLFTDRFG